MGKTRVTQDLIGLCSYTSELVNLSHVSVEDLPVLRLGPETRYLLSEN